MADYEGDLRQRCRTISTVWGRRPARIIFRLVLDYPGHDDAAPICSGSYSPIYAYIVVFGVYPVLVYILVKVNRYRTGPQLERLSQLMKYDF
ncbi:MAG: hypothetical protein IPJ94_13815 [Chloroflexi bacterium]|nr:hypothetical protein [Chloroflexota bacterium]